MSKNMYDYSLLKELSQAFGPSGDESMIANIIEDAVKPYCNEIRRDSIGNLIVIKKGNKKRIMVAAHMDEIGVIVTYIDKNGFLRFSAIGGIRNSELNCKKVVFSNGVIGVISKEKTLRSKNDSQPTKYFIDIGVTSKKEAEELISIGDSAVFEGNYHQNGTRIISKALDNRIGCFVAIKALQQVKTDNELIFVFTTQEEVGTRGAQIAAYQVVPDLALTIDTTIADDIPKEFGGIITSLNKGIGIKVMDQSIIVSPVIKKWISQIAEENDIPYQFEILENGGTDSGPIHLTKGGIPTGGLSIPVRYIHSESEMAEQLDVDAGIDLLKRLIEE